MRRAVIALGIGFALAACAVGSSAGDDPVHAPRELEAPFVGLPARDAIAELAGAPSDPPPLPDPPPGGCADFCGGGRPSNAR